MKNPTRRTLTFLLAMAVVTAAAAICYARAGGAGGGGGGGGGDDGIGLLIELVILLLFELPFPLNIIATGAVIAVFVFFSWATKKKVRERSVFNKIPSPGAEVKPRKNEAFLKNNPAFDEAGFIENVKGAFMKIQAAWQEQDIGPARRFISDGVYQRFNTQFIMMKKLKQKNVLSDISINNIYIDRAESDGLFDILHVAIFASMNDRFVCELDNSLNSGGFERFVEYWSFIKKRGVTRKDIYRTDDCPNCGTPLPKNLGEMSRCPACGTLTNTGEYDWVLSEITQADDYSGRHPKLRKSDGLNEKVRAIIEENRDFSVQLIEDRASNGYLQMLTAVAAADPSLMRRFVSDEVFGRMKARIADGAAAYNRLFLNDVYLVGAASDGEKNHLAVAVRSSYQRVALRDGKAVLLDPAVISNIEVLLMSRDRTAAAAKGSVYAHQCPNCGAPVTDSLDVKCPYCGSDFNSTASDWIITKVLAPSEYEALDLAKAGGKSYTVSPSLVESLYDVRDFAFKNVLVVAASDGVISGKEEESLRALAAKWGYNAKKIEPLIARAISGGLAIQMPEDAKKRKKILRLMEKAAQWDETVTEKEKALLEEIRARYSIDDAA